MKSMLCLAVLGLVVLPACHAAILAGVAKINATLPVGVPLAGYNHGDRRVPDWPIPKETEYTSFMTPSVGHMDATWVKVLLLNVDNTTVCFVTMDAIGSDSTIRRLAIAAIQAKGIPVTDDAFLLSASHSHSGPGGVTPNLLWALAPATDLLVPELQEAIIQHIVDGVVAASASMVPAVLGVGSGLLTGVTVNRRANISPYLKPDSIDPNLGIIRVDALDGTPLATVWNYAIHGVCFGPDNMLSSADIMGGVSDHVESLVGGVALFMNADAGDIDPSSQTCEGKPNFEGAPIIAARIQQVRGNVTTAPTAQVAGFSQAVAFGLTELNITLQRWENCTSGGFLDICTLCRVIHCELDPHLNSAWLEENPTYTALRFTINGLHSLVVTIPGEGLFDLGNQIRNDSLAIGFDTVLLAGYTQAHCGYFATATEYDIGGYESELTFWGIGTADKVRQSCKMVASAVAPPSRG